MPESMSTRTTRQLGDVAGEDRIINKPVSVAERPRSYQDAGVQTLPPPNGDVYALVYGCEPSAIDHFRIGIAAIGRFTEGPQSNPYEPLHGTAYPIPAGVQAERVDSGFQVAGCDATRLALTRAKAKASMMANKYRKVAFEAGYVISPEIENEMIVHSEQYPSTVRLDRKGNLLEGSTKGRYIPNISGTAQIDQTKKRREVNTAIREEKSEFVSGNASAGITKEAPDSALPQPPLTTPETAGESPTAKIMAFAPSSFGVTSNSIPVADNEYGSGEIYNDGFVVYGATSSNDPSALNIITTPISSPSRQNFGENQNDEEGADKLKVPNEPPGHDIDTATSLSSPKKRKLGDTHEGTNRAKKAKMITGQIVVQQSADEDRVESPVPSRGNVRRPAPKSRIKADSTYSQQPGVDDETAKVSASLSTVRDGNNSVRRTAPNVGSRKLSAEINSSFSKKISAERASSRNVTRTEPKDATVSKNTLERTVGLRRKHDHQSPGKDDRGLMKALLRGSAAKPKTGEMQSSSGRVISDQEPLDRSVEKPSPRPQRNRRPEFTPYVPPALRGKARKVGSDEKAPKPTPKR